MRPLGTLLAAALLVSTACASAHHEPGTTNVAKATNYVGQTTTICDRVTSAFYAESSEGSPTFLDFGPPYPRHTFSVVIWKEDRGKFDQPELFFLDHEVCVTGEVKEFHGKPQIVLRDPSSIKTVPGERDTVAPFKPPKREEAE